MASSNTKSKSQNSITSSLRKTISRLNRQQWLLVLMVLLTATAAGLFAWQYMAAKGEIERLRDPQTAAQAETDRLVKQVGELIELPADETPTIATVVDKERLRDQAFFARAENGDRVLIYTQARKAVLYRPATGKIIEVAPINIGESQQKSDQSQR